jgi:hypothetical protein
VKQRVLEALVGLVGPRAVGGHRVVLEALDQFQLTMKPVIARSGRASRHFEARALAAVRAQQRRGGAVRR